MSNIFKNINCNCNNEYNTNEPNDGLLGVRQIVDSHMICNNSARAVFFKNGGCDIVPKGYIPGGKDMLTSNGPKLIGAQQWGNNPSPESEGMDSLNYVFNKNRHG